MQTHQQLLHNCIRRTNYGHISFGSLRADATMRFAALSLSLSLSLLCNVTSILNSFDARDVFSHDMCTCVYYAQVLNQLSRHRA